jgi:thiamine biosynthesis lipoprotein
MRLAPAGEHERRFPIFGTKVRLLIGPALGEHLPSPAAVALQLEGLMRVMHDRMTRFDPQSELSRLNADPRETVEASSLLLAALRAGVWAAERSGGLVDPTLIDELEAIGYARTRTDEPPAPIREALASAPERRPARPRDGSAWRSFELQADRGIVSRPVGARVDLGGTAKGLAADLAASKLGGYASFAVDVGGDMRIGGASAKPREVRVEHPLADRLAHSFPLAQGAVATSGISTRLWRRSDGYAHHLIDPSTGAPAWTGLLQVTAVAPTAVEAEVLAKTAFLSGPGDAARDALSRYGGIVVSDEGSVDLVGPLATEVATAAEAA